MSRGKHWQGMVPGRHSARARLKPGVISKPGHQGKGDFSHDGQGPPGGARPWGSSGSEPGTEP